MLKLKGNPVPDHVALLGDDAIGFYARHGHELHARGAQEGVRFLISRFRRWLDQRR